MKALADPTRLRKWLKRKIAVQIAEFLVMGCGTLVVGILILAVVYAFFSVLTGVAMVGVTALAELLGARNFHVHVPVVCGIAGIFVAILFLGAERSARDTVGFYPSRNQSAPDNGVWGSFVTLLVGYGTSEDFGNDLLFTGPRFVIYSVACFRKCIRLMRIDLAAATETVTALSRKFHRTSLSELSKLLGGKDPMKVLFKLQEMDFVIFLSREPAGVILTLEIQEELNRLIGPALDFEQEPEPATAEEPIQPEPVDGQQYYDLLGIDPTASLTQIKAAYRSRIKQCHPDKFVGRGEDFRKLAEERAKALNKAYEILKTRHGVGGSYR